MKNKKGFTLVEIIIVMAIFTVIVGGVMTIFYPGFTLFGKESEITAAKNLANQTVSVLKNEIRSANNYIGSKCPVDIGEDYKKTVVSINQEGHILFNGVLPDALPIDAYTDFHLTTNFSQGANSASTLSSVVKIDVSVLSKTSNEIVYEISVLVSSVNPEVEFMLTQSKVTEMCLVKRK